MSNNSEEKPTKFELVHATQVSSGKIRGVKFEEEDIAIKVEGLSKKYLTPQIRQAGKEAPNFYQKLKEFFPGFLGTDDADYFYALNDISFQARRGEILGIIGENGSGKSTLLKILSGLTPPSRGSATISGSVGSLLEVGTGFHPDLTGRENIYFNGALLGVPRAKIEESVEDIIEFSGVRRFIDMPLKRYSSGMQVRLAYSVATLLQTDILLLDEVLAVGDGKFRAQSKDDMKARALEGATVLFVSHSMEQIREICDKCLILDRGKIVFNGSMEDAVSLYWRKQMGIPIKVAGGISEEDLESSEENENSSSRNAFKKNQDFDLSAMARYGKFKTQHLSKLWIFDPDDKKSESFCTGGKFGFRVELENLENYKDHELGIIVCLHSNLMWTSASFSTFNQPIVITASTRFCECVVNDLRVGKASYSLSVTLCKKGSNTWLDNLDCIGHVCYIDVDDREFFKGREFVDGDGAAHRQSWRLVD